MTILVSLLSVTSLCVGHSKVMLETGWEETGPLWFMVVMDSGGGKSITYTYFKTLINEIYEKVLANLSEVEHNLPKQRQVILPTSASWEKLGDIIANNVGRAISLNDEAVSFFVSNNMLSQQLKIIDGREFRSFLSFFGADGIERSTVTERCNHKLKSCHLSFLGFTQPDSAKAIISHRQSGLHGFFQRFLWFFPPEKFSSYRELQLYKDEETTLKNFRTSFVEKMANIYCTKDTLSTVRWNDKVIDVDPAVQPFKLSPEAETYHETEYDQTSIRMLNSKFSTVKGQYNKSRGMMLRVAATMEVLEQIFGDENVDIGNEITITKKNMQIGTQFVQMLVDQAVHIYKNNCSDLPHEPSAAVNNDAFVIKKLLLVPGHILSGKILLARKSVLRARRDGERPKETLSRILTDMEDKGFGDKETLEGQYPIIYFRKKPLAMFTEDEKNSLTTFGISTPEYERKLFARTDESSQHTRDYERHNRVAVNENVAANENEEVDEN